MTAINLLTKAIQYELTGRKLESLKLYQDGIGELMKMCQSESDPDKKKHFQKKIAEYMAQAEKLKAFIQTWGSRGEIRDKIHITDGAKNFGYDRVFGKYLTEEVEEILIEEPYMKDYYQLCNLVMFCELALTQCRNLKCIKVTTNKDSTNSQSEQQVHLDSIAESLAAHNVIFYYDFTTSMHDRQVLLSNGYVIKIGRGFHYFKPLPGKPKPKLGVGQYNFNFRECRETNIDIFYCPENYKADSK